MRGGLPGAQHLRAGLTGRPMTRSAIDMLSAVAVFLIGRLIGLVAGPELRVTYAIANAAKRARRDCDEAAASTERKRSSEW